MFLVEVIAKPNCYCTSSAYFSGVQPKLRNDVAKKSGLTSLGNGMDSPRQLTRCQVPRVSRLTILRDHALMAFAA